MSARIIQLFPARAMSHTNPANSWVEAARFNSSCPTCSDLRAQLGYSLRALSRLLRRDQPIEAHCAICNGYWQISDRERARLACELDLARS